MKLSVTKVSFAAMSWIVMDSHLKKKNGPIFTSDSHKLCLNKYRMLKSHILILFSRNHLLFPLGPLRTFLTKKAKVFVMALRFKELIYYFVVSPATTRCQH